MIKFNQIAEQAIELEARSLLSDFPMSEGTLDYYWPSIEADINESLDADGRVMSAREREAILDAYVSDDRLLSIGDGMWRVRGRYAIAAPQEIEIDLSHLHWTDARIEAVSRWSDVTVLRGGSGVYGYVTTDMHLDLDTSADAIADILLAPFDLED